MKRLLGSVSSIMLAIAMTMAPASADDRELCANAAGDEAIAACGRAIASGTFTSRDLARAFHSRGLQYWAKGDLGQAIADYDAAVRLDPKFAPAFMARGNVHNARGTLEPAIADYSEALRLDPGDALARSSLNVARAAFAARRAAAQTGAPPPNAPVLGTSLAAIAEDRATCDKPEGDASVAACGRAIASGSFEGAELAKIFYSRGNKYRGKQDFDRAIADLSEAIRLDPGFASAYFARAYSHQFKRNLDQAIADYSEAIRLNPRLTAAYNNRGNVYHVKGDLTRASADYDAALRLDPKYTFAYHNRGRIYSERGNHDHALVDYNEALRLDPRYVNAYLHRGNSYQAKGDLDRAIADYSEALRLDPQNADARRSLEQARTALAVRGPSPRAGTTAGPAPPAGSNQPGPALPHQTGSSTTSDACRKFPALC